MPPDDRPAGRIVLPHATLIGQKLPANVRVSADLLDDGMHEEPPGALRRPVTVSFPCGPYIHRCAGGRVNDRVRGAMIVRMSDTGFALFDTAVGRCGIAWGPRGVRAVQLPGPGDAATRARLLGLAPGAAEAAPPASVAAVIADIVALLAGERRDLSAAPLDLDGVPAFNRRVYAVALAIPPGETLTYGEVAARLGEPGAARAVGKALGENPVPIVVPCHRVLAAGGRLGGFSAPGGSATKQKLLVIEGARPNAAAGQSDLFDPPG